MRFLLLSFVCLMCGCAPTMETRTYEVAVKNESSKPVTVWLTKDGPAYEPNWRSPEEIANERPGFDDRISGVIVPPGRIAETGKMTGTFAPSTQAILRVYLGERKFTELLAMSRGHADRIDSVLDPGTTMLVVSDSGPGIKVAKTP